MARITGLVSNVNVSEVKEGDKYEPGVWVSVEGFSLLVGRNCTAIPEAGTEITAVVSVRWPREKGKKPLHFLESWRQLA